MKYSDKDRRGFKIFAVLGAVALIFIGGYIYAVVTKVPVDTQNCAVGGDGKTRLPTAQVVILIDQSEAFTPNQQNIIMSKLVSRLGESLEVGTLVSVYEFNKQKYFDLSPSFSQCVPKRDVNPLIGNRARVRQFLEGHFARPLRQSVQESISNVSGDESPIIEAIQAVGRSSHVDPKASRERDLIVISDMLQHKSRTYSHYGRAANFEEFRASSYGREVMPDLRGWGLVVMYVARYGNGKSDQNKAHLQFWRELFRESGANLNEWEPVS